MPTQAAKYSIDAERERSSAKMAKKRKAGRDLTIPACKHPRLRRKALKDPQYFLQRYWPTKFFNAFTNQHVQMIDSIMERIRYGGRQALAASRGEGKSSIIEGMVGLYAILAGLRRFPLIVGATQGDGCARLSTIMEQYETNDALLEDFPEVCHPIRMMEGSPRRGAQQTVGGVRTRIKWGSGNNTEEIRFPLVKGSKASGSWIMARGITSSMLGLVRGSLRPDIVILDDVETQSSVVSPAETKKIRTMISRTIVPMGGQKERIAIFMPCTIRAKNCIADAYTDRARSPAWMGFRFRFVEQWPDCHGAQGEADLWAVYRKMRQEDQQGGDETGRRAHRFYLDNREAMDAGAIISNVNRYDPTECPDGSQSQVSALQMVMDWIADAESDGDADAWGAFESEFQNEPSEAGSPVGSGCTVEMVRNAVNGVAMGIVPDGVQYLTAGIDVHGFQLYYTVIGWIGSAGCIIAYGTWPVNSPTEGRLGDSANIENVSKAILDALCEWRDWEAENGWPCGSTGEVRHVDRVLVDSGWKPDPVYEFVGSSPRPVYWCVNGDGSAKSQDRYRQPTAIKKNQKLGHHYWAGKVPGRRAWLIHSDADFWKRFIHDGFSLAAAKGESWTMATPVSMSLFGADRLRHNGFAAQIICEQMVEQFVEGTGIVRKWQQRHGENHWLDTTGYACCGAAVAGVRFANVSARRPNRGRGVHVVGKVKHFGRK